MINKAKGVGLGLAYSISLTFIVLPLLAFLKKEYFKELNSQDIEFVWSALRVSAICSLIAIGIVILLGMPTGYFMARSHFRGKGLLDILFHIPTVLPPAVIGLIMLMTFGSKGFIGKYLYALGIGITFSKIAVILTLVFVSLPIFINGVCEGFKKVDRDLEITAMTLGDKPIQVFWRVTFPLAKSSIYISLIMAWARGLAEFGATMMFAGNIKGVTQTAPLAIYTAMESNMNLSMLLALIMMVIALAVLVLVHIIGKKSKL